MKFYQYLRTYFSNSFTAFSENFFIIVLSSVAFAKSGSSNKAALYV